MRRSGARLWRGLGAREGCLSNQSTRRLCSRADCVAVPIRAGSFPPICHAMLLPRAGSCNSRSGRTFWACSVRMPTLLQATITLLDSLCVRCWCDLQHVERIVFLDKAAARIGALERGCATRRKQQNNNLYYLGEELHQPIHLNDFSDKKANQFGKQRHTAPGRRWRTLPLEHTKNLPGRGGRFCALLIACAETTPTNRGNKLACHARSASRRHERARFVCCEAPVEGQSACGRSSRGPLGPGGLLPLGGASPQ